MTGSPGHPGHPPGGIRGAFPPKADPLPVRGGFCSGDRFPGLGYVNPRATAPRLDPLARPGGGGARTGRKPPAPRAWDAGGRCRPRRRPANSRELALRGRISMPGRHAAREHAIRCRAIVTRTRRSWRACRPRCCWPLTFCRSAPEGCCGFCWPFHNGAVARPPRRLALAGVRLFS